jgi:hypothetical protein
MKPTLFALLIFASCGSQDQVTGVHPEQAATMSGCGGWDFGTGLGKPTDLETYCAAERLFVSYDPATARLTLDVARAMFNCCSQRELEVGVEDDGTYVLDIHEDYVDGESAVCGCACTFDYQVTVDKVPAGAIPFRMQYRFHDEEAAPFFTGTLDLAPGPVEYIVSDYPALEGVCGDLLTP